MDELEELVKRAPNDPAAQDEFYRAFLDSFITIPHGNSPDELKIENGVLKQGVELKLPSVPSGGHDCVPVFSSPESMARSWPKHPAYIRLRGRDFLAIVEGAYVVLNPGGWGKNLLPDEIDAMLKGQVFGGPRRIVTKKPEKILLGQPSQYPTKLVEALKAAFTRFPGVRAAYLAHCFAPSFGDTPHTAIGIDADDYDKVVVDIGPDVTSSIERGQVVDFVSIRDNNAISSYMLKETKPFYSSGRPKEAPPAPTKAGFWKRLFGG